MQNKYQIIVILSILTLCICITCKNKNNFDLRQKHIENLDDCYIYFNIKHKTADYKVVCTAIKLSGLINTYVFKKHLNNNEFQLYLDTTLFKKGFIPVNDSIFYYLEYSCVKQELINKYENVDIVSKFHLSTPGKFPDSLDYENEKALIYLLLSKGLMRCCIDDETGITLLLKVNNDDK